MNLATISLLIATAVALLALQQRVLAQDVPPASDPATWTFDAAQPDAFSPQAILDLRSLNEPTAGQNGWMYAKGGKLYIPGSDKPFRGWSAGLRPFGCNYEMKELEYTARIFAKLGVNQIREMSDANVAVLPRPDAPDVTQIDATGLAKLHRLVAAMKAQGIYVTYCPWWEVGVRGNSKFPGFANAKPFYWCKDLKELAKGWYRQILTTKNPHTGLSLAEDPAVNIIELQNEQNLFFWGLTPACCDPARWQELRRQFTEFVRTKHGSIEKALAEWQLTDAERRQFVEGEGAQTLLQVADNSKMLAGGLTWYGRGTNRYAADLIEFITDLERRYNEEISRFIKEDLGYKGLILGGDWMSCDAALLEDLARWGTLPPHGDCIGYHQYSSFFHLNPTHPSYSGYRIGAGDYFAEGSVLATPNYIPANYKRMRDVPMICTEMGLPGPNRFALEGQLTAAAYGSLQDFDQITWLQTEFMGWGHNIGGDGVNKFNHNWPHLLGQFPGAALLFRMGYVREAPVVVSEKRPVSDYAAKKLPLIANVRTGDPLYDRPGDPKQTPADPAGAPLPNGVDPLAFQVGAVEYEIGSPAQQKVDQQALQQCIDRSKKSVRSVTGELLLDWGRQLLTINTPCAQGAVGLLHQAGAIELKDVTITCDNDLASVLVISMDGKPLTESAKILIQAVTESNLTGWKTAAVPPGTSVQISSDGQSRTVVLPAGAQRIEALGKPPFQIQRVKASITFRDGKSRSATTVDLHGCARAGEAALQASSTPAGLRIMLPEDTSYTIVQ